MPQICRSHSVLPAAIGYTIYYLSFVVAGVAIYFLRTRGGYRSLPHMLVEKYGSVCAKLFLITIGFRLLNEVWSNTKVMSLYFGPEGSGSLLGGRNSHHTLHPVLCLDWWNAGEPSDR